MDRVLEEFERTYHLLHCFPDVRSLVEPVARIEEIQRVQFVLFKCKEVGMPLSNSTCIANFLSLMAPSYVWVWHHVKALISGC